MKIPEVQGKNQQHNISLGIFLGSNGAQVSLGQSVLLTWEFSPGGQGRPSTSYGLHLPDTNDIYIYKGEEKRSTAVP